MSNLSDFLGGSGGATTEVHNAYSDGGATATNLVVSNPTASKNTTLSLTTSFQDMLSITGSGRMPLCLLALTGSVTSRTLTLEVEVDGNIVFSAACGTVTTADYGLYAAGNPTYMGVATWVLGPGSPIVFNKSLVVRAKSSVTTTPVRLSYIVT